MFEQMKELEQRKKDQEQMDQEMLKQKVVQDQKVIILKTLLHQNEHLVVAFSSTLSNLRNRGKYSKSLLSYSNFNSLKLLKWRQERKKKRNRTLLMIIGIRSCRK